MPYHLEMDANLSKTIFFAQVLSVGATGKVKIDKRDTALYSNITVKVEKILRSDARPLNTGDTIELTAVDDVHELGSRLFDQRDNGGFILFYWDNDQYTLSGDRKKDPIFARRMLSLISFSKTNVTKTISFPCQHEILDKTYGVPQRDRELSGYIKAQRGQ